MKPLILALKRKEHNEAHLAKMMAEKFDYGFHTMQLEDQNLYDQLLSATYFQDEPIMHLSEPHLLAVSTNGKTFRKSFAFWRRC